MPLPIWVPFLGPLISVINLVKPGAVNNNPEAAKALDSTLSKLETHYKAISETLKELTSLPVDDPAKLHEAKTSLYDVTSGKLRSTLMAARAHCGEIGLAYDVHLRGWFAGLTQPHLQADLKELFDELREVDASFVGSMATVADYAEAKARALLPLVEKADASSRSEAKRMVDAIERDVWENKLVLNAYLAQMREAHADFLERISGSRC